VVVVLGQLSPSYEYVQVQSRGGTCNTSIFTTEGLWPCRKQDTTEDENRSEDTYRAAQTCFYLDILVSFYNKTQQKALNDRIDTFGVLSA